MSAERVTPRVIWQGHLGGSTEIFRLTDRGIRAESKTNRRFHVEQARGRDAMGKRTWVGPGMMDENNFKAALLTLGSVLGRVINMKPEELVSGHTISCDLNMAVIDGRESRDCDCGTV